MERKRKNISAKVRWDVFTRDSFKCVYCGASSKEATLVVDHGDPFSKGGEDGMDNFVTACRSCNAGKGATVILPKAAWIDDEQPDHSVFRRGIRYRNHLLADWGDALRQVAYSLQPGERRSVSCVTDSRESIIETDFLLDPLTMDFGQKIHVVVLPARDAGTFTKEEESRIRDAAILGYSEPTMILIGSPWYFWGVVVSERYKGFPRGFELDEDLGRVRPAFACGWYPDETWKFADPRAEFPLRPCSFSGRAWRMTVAEIGRAHV